MINAPLKYVFDIWCKWLGSSASACLWIAPSNQICDKKRKIMQVSDDLIFLGGTGNRAVFRGIFQNLLYTSTQCSFTSNEINCIGLQMCITYKIYYFQFELVFAVDHASALKHVHEENANKTNAATFDVIKNVYAYAIRYLSCAELH